MNLLEGGLSADLGSLRIGSQLISLPDDVVVKHPGLKRYGGAPLIVGIRPEDLSVAGGQDARTVLEADVELVEALGSELLVHFRTDARASVPRALASPGRRGCSRPASLVSQPSVARVEPRQQVRPGDRVSLLLSPDRLEFFVPRNRLAVWE